MPKRGWETTIISLSHNLEGLARKIKRRQGRTKRKVEERKKEMENGKKLYWEALAKYASFSCLRASSRDFAAANSSFSSECLIFIMASTVGGGGGSYIFKE